MARLSEEMALPGKPWGRLVNSRFPLKAQQQQQQQQGITIWKPQDPSLVTYRCLQRLAAAFDRKAFQNKNACDEENEISSTLNYLVRHGVVAVNVANTVCGFFLESCLLLWEDFLSSAGCSLVDMFIAFFKKLDSFSHLDLWKACVLALMAIAAAAFPEKLSELRELNGSMDLRTTVGCMPASFQGVPATCSLLVHCGLAVQASFDLQRGGDLHQDLALTDALVLSDGLLAMFSTCRLAAYLDTFFSFITAALASFDASHVDAGAASKTLTRIVTVMEKLEDADYSKASETLISILSRFSSARQLKVLKAVIQEKLASKQLVSLLVRVYRLIHEHVGEELYSGLADLLEFLFTSQAIYFYPSDDETNNAILGEERTFAEQLQTVHLLVVLYLLTIRLELEGGTNYSGLLSPEALEHAASCWLTPLLEQARMSKVTDPFRRFDQELVEAAVEYAVEVTADPPLVLREGVPPW